MAEAIDSLRGTIGAAIAKAPRVIRLETCKIPFFTYPATLLPGALFLKPVGKRFAAQTGSRSLIAVISLGADPACGVVMGVKALIDYFLNPAILAHGQHLEPLCARRAREHPVIRQLCLHPFYP